MGVIRELESATVHKIAAGEVIDRPASVIKELIENSLDAGATAITVRVRDGGIQMMEITDNGVGIAKEDLALAVRRHATSKIQTVEDIYDLGTMGFRGEALASVSAVGQLTIISCAQGAEDAFQIEGKDGEASEPELAVHRTGTTIRVENLFESIPVRRKTLKRPAFELSEIKKVVMRLALHHPQVAFVLENEAGEQLNTTGMNDQQALMVQFFGQELEGKLIHVDYQGKGIHLTGWITDPTLTFSNRNKQFFAVNDRAIQTGLFYKWVADAYKDVIPNGRFPAVVLNLGLQKDTVDVNIHPKKWEVKFFQSDVLFRTIPVVIRKQFMVLNTPDQFTQNIAQIPSDHSRYSNYSSSFTPLQPAYESHVSQSMDLDQSLKSMGVETPKPFKEVSAEIPTEQIYMDPMMMNQMSTQPMTFSQVSDENHAQGSQPLEFLQVFNTYLAVKFEDGLWLLDQHAVHERILYERFKHDAAQRLSDQQPLLLSEVVPLEPDLMAVYHDVEDHLRSLHFTVEPFGGDQVVIREVPLLFSSCSASQWLISFLEEVQTFGGKKSVLTDDLKDTLQMKACKAAIKAGQKLHPSEVEGLLRGFFQSPSNFTCPHGRPLFVKLDKVGLEKLFHRR